MIGLADLLNAPTELEFEGVTYQLREPTVPECGAYQRWLEAGARAGAAAATELPEADRLLMLREVSRDIGARVYAWGGELCVNSLRTPDGLAKLLNIVCTDQGMTHEMARKICDKRLMDIAGSLLALAEEAEGDPEKKAELARLLRSTGLPPNYLSRPSSASPTSGGPPPSSPSSE